MSLRNTGRTLAVGSLLLALAGCNSSKSGRPLSLLDQGVERSADTGAPVVLEDELRADVYFLASDRLEGRGVGTDGLDVAADYIATRFQSLGLRPLPGLGSYFQPFEMTTAESIAPETALAVGDRAYKVKSDFTPLSFSGEGAFDAPVVFAGYGITDPKNGYDDYAGVDVKGKVVLAMRYEPHDARGKSRWGKDDWTTNAHLETKARVAAEHGAAALILVNPPTFHDDSLMPFARQSVGAGTSLPIVHVKRAVADEILKRGGAGASLKDLQAKLDAAAKPASVELGGGATVRGRVVIKRTRRTVKNVVAYLPGAGPTADEYVIVGSHYDHLGWGGAGSLMNTATIAGMPVPLPSLNPHGLPATEPAGHGTTRPAVSQAAATTRPTSRPTARAIHHGADDNASGTATMLELARIFAHRAATQPPARSIIFMAFTAEESGLVGSARFVNHPPIDLKKAAAMLNLDMVGRVRKNMLYVGGGGTAPPFKAMLKRADEGSPLEFKNFGDGGLGPSDHMSFALKKVPVVFLFSGVHEDYHRPTDTADKVNFDAMAEVARVGVELVEDFARMPKAQYVDAADKSTMMSPMSTGTGGEGGRRASLGVIPEYGQEEEGKGVKIGGTTPDTPAAKAGLQAGDVVLRLGDHPTTTLMELSTALASQKPGDRVKLVYKRGEKEQTVTITLGERKG
jgi:Zn-dependent M28 family amino/carboxypeptidase